MHFVLLIIALLFDIETRREWDINGAGLIIGGWVNITTFLYVNFLFLIGKIVLTEIKQITVAFRI